MIKPKNKRVTFTIQAALGVTALVMVSKVESISQKGIQHAGNHISVESYQTGNSLFKLIYQNSGSKVINADGYAVLMGDINSDGFNDVIFMNHGFRPSILLNMNGENFNNIFSSSGLRWGNWEYAEQDDRHGGSCVDFDNDGDVDLLITHGAKKGESLGIKHAELLANDGNGHFVEIGRASGLLNTNGRGRISSWADYDSDGFLDAYMANFESKSILYKNNGDALFTDISDSMQLNNISVRAAWSDLNFDGKPDLLVSWPLNILMNNGENGFISATDSTIQIDNLLPKPPYSIALGDLDDDGDNDLILGGYASGSRIYWNENGKFSPDDDELNFLGGQRGAAVQIVDIDNDSDLDILVATSDELFLHRNLTERVFHSELIDLTTDNGFNTSGGIATGDLDNDGYPDLAVQTETHNLIALNQHSGNRWLKLKLHGTQSNRQGIGAKIWVTLEDGKTIYREYWGHNGVYKSLSCTNPLIGVAKSKKVNVKITWPSGMSKSYTNVSTNKTTTLHERPFLDGLISVFLQSD